MNTLFGKVLLAAVMTFAIHNNVLAENTPKPPVTAQVNEADFQHHYTDVAGQRIHYVTAGKGEPVLLIPGWPQTWYTWRYVMTGLAAQGYMAIAVDPPGTGFSAWPDSGYDTGAVATTLHTMMNQLGYKTYSVVGHDIGMWVGYALAGDYPADIKKIVLTEAVIPVWHRLRYFC